MRTTIWAAAAVTVGVLGLAGCGDSGSDTGSSASAQDSTASQSSSGSSAGSSSASADAVLATADSSFGQIVVDGQGRTAYVFDKDTAGSGTSACSGQCLQIWPAITADSAQPTVDGVDGKVGTLTRDDGTLQVTLDGMPLYTYAPDAQAGDVNGQGVQGVWWVVSPDGQKITSEAAASPTPVSPTY